MRISKILAVLLALCLILTGYLGFRVHALDGDLHDLRLELAASKKNAEQLQVGRREQQSRATWLEQAKRGLEGQNAALRAEAEHLKAELEAMAEEKKSSVALAGQRSSALAQACEERAEALGKRLSSAEEKLKVSSEAWDSGQRRLAELIDSKQSLEAELSRTSSSLDTCISHNTSLSGMARELIKRYEEKSVAEVLAQKEPFTQIQRAKMEAVLQEYESKIREHEMSSSQ
jgi:chromosome segregation ATPase